MMKELSVVELEAVSGAGWLQDNLAAMGSKIGAIVWEKSASLLNVEAPLVGTVNLAVIAPDLGKSMGQSVGSAIGGAIENALIGLPVVGNILNKWLNK